VLVAWADAFPAATALGGIPAEVLTGPGRELRAAGAPEGLSRRAAAALDVFALLDVTDICVRTGESAETVIPLYFTISERYDIDRTLVRITELPRVVERLETELIPGCPACWGKSSIPHLNLNFDLGEG
jgi:hypothetical protein